MADEIQPASESTAPPVEAVRDDASAVAATGSATEIVGTPEPAAAPAKDFQKALADLGDMSDADLDRFIKDNPTHRLAQRAEREANARASQRIEKARRDAAAQERSRIEAETNQRQSEQQRLRDEQQELELLDKLEREDYETLSQQGKERAQQIRTNRILRDPKVVENLLAQPDFQAKLKAHPDLRGVIGNEALGLVGDEVRKTYEHEEFRGLGQAEINAAWQASENLPDMFAILSRKRLQGLIESGDLVPKAEHAKLLAAARQQAKTEALGGVPDRDLNPGVGNGSSNGSLTPEAIARMSPAEYMRNRERLMATARNLRS